MHWGRAGRGEDEEPIRHIDQFVLTSLVDDLGAEHASEVCQLFLADARDRMEAVRSACGAGDAEAVARSVHRLKSAAGFVGAGGVSELCREIEQLARGDRLHEVPRRVELVCNELAQASGELASLLAGVHRPG